MLGGEDSVVIVLDLPNATWPDNRTVSVGIYSHDGDGNVVYDLHIVRRRHGKRKPRLQVGHRLRRRRYREGGEVGGRGG